MVKTSSAIPELEKTVKISHGANGTKRVSMVSQPSPKPKNNPSKTSSHPVMTHASKRHFTKPTSSVVSHRPPTPNQHLKIATATKSKGGGGGKARISPTVAQGTAAMSKGATPAMKKGALDRQSSFINDTLYTALEKLGEEMALEDCQYIFYFYHSYIKLYLDKEVDGVRSMKTGGALPLHLCKFIPLNKHLQISPDVVEISQDVKSMAQLKFYKMLIFKIMERTNKALRDSGFKGKVYLRKNFYSNLQVYWETAVQPGMELEKLQRQQAEDKAGGDEMDEEMDELAEDHNEQAEEDELAMRQQDEEEVDDDSKERADEAEAALREDGGSGEEGEGSGVEVESWYGDATQPIVD